MSEPTFTVHHDPLGSFEIFGALIQIFFVLGCAWLIIGHRYLLEGEDMERPVNRIAQLYGYAVCLIAVIIFLVTVRSIASALITLSDPLAQTSAYGQSLESFEAYKATINAPNTPYVTPVVAPGAGKTTPSDAVLRQRYEALRADRIASNTYQAKSDLTLNGLMLAIAIILFVLHWRWLRKLSPS